MPDLIYLGRTVASFVVVLGVLVTVHELGHYLAARWAGVGVEAFSIGFGSAVARWTDRRGTVWKIGWIPLGGYVKMHGQERPETVPDEVRASWDERRTYQHKPVGKRAVIIAAGPVANFLLAIFLLSAMFAFIGRPVVSSVVGSVASGSAAEHGGMLAGDRILGIDGVPVSTFADIQHVVVGRPGKSVTVVAEREGHRLDLPVTLDSVGGDQPIGRLGVGNGAPYYVPVRWPEAIIGGVAQAWDVGVQTLSGIGQMLVGHRGADDLGGPLRIAQLSGQVAANGVGPLISFIALLSINVGLVNLFPVPVLDGGHLVFLFLEKLRGRPVPQRAQEIGFHAGLALLGALFLFTTLNDLGHLGLFRLFTSRG